MSSHYDINIYEEADSPRQDGALTPSHAVESSSGSAQSSGQGTINEGTTSGHATDMDATLRRGQANPTEHGQLSASSSADDNLIYQSQEATESSDHIGHLAEPSNSALYNHPNTSSTSAAPPSSWVARLTGRNRSSSVDSPPSSHFTFPSRLRTTTANADVGLPQSAQYGSPHQLSPGGNLASPGRPQIVVSPTPSHPQPNQPRNRLSLSRLSLSRSAKHAERAERRHRPPTSSGIAQSSLHHPEDMPYLQRTLSVSEMRLDPSASNDNITDGTQSIVNEKLSGRRKLFNRSSNTSSSSVMDKSHPPPSSSGKARQILRYLDSATGGSGRSGGNGLGYGGTQRDSDLSSIRGSNISSDTLASTATSDLRRRSGDSNFASSVAGSIPNWAKRIGKSNKTGVPPSSYTGGLAGSPGAQHYQPATSPLVGPVRPGRSDREVSPAFSDDSSAAAHDGRFQPAPSHLSASTHSGSETHSTTGRGDFPLTPPGPLPPTPSTSFPSSAGPGAARPASTSGPALSSSTSRFSLPLTGGVGFERALRFFMDPDASSNSLGKGGSAAEQQGIWLLGVWHGPPSNADGQAQDSQQPSLTPSEEPPQSRLSSASPIPVSSKAEQNTSSDARQSPAASMQRGSMSSQSRGGYPRNSSSEALTSPGTSAPSSVSAQSSPEKIHTRLPPPSVSSGSISTRSSIDHSNAPYGAYSSRTTGKRGTDGSSVEGRSGSRAYPPSASARHARPMSREGSASTASGTESLNRSDRGGFVPERQDSRSSQPLPSPSLNSQASGARFPQLAGAGAPVAAGSPRPVSDLARLSAAEQAMQWQANFQADFTSRIWCTYRNHFTPISRDGTISMQAESGPMALGGGDTPVPPATPGSAAASSGAVNTSGTGSGPGQSVRQWIGRRLGEGGSSQDLLSVSPSYAGTTSGGFTSGSPSLSSMQASSSSATISAISPGGGAYAAGPGASAYGRSPQGNSGGIGNPFSASIGAGAGFLSATSSVAGGLGEKMGIPGLWGRATAAAQAVGLTGRNGLTTDAGWGCMLRTGQSLLANALMDIHLGREWRRKESAVASRIAALQQAFQQSGMAGAATGPIPLHIAPEATLLDPSDPEYDAKRQTVEEQWRTAKAEYAKYVRLVSWFLDDPCLACPFSVHRMAREGKRLGKEVGEWFGPSTAAGAIKQLVTEFPDAGLGVCVAMDQVVYLAEVREAAVDSRKGQWGRVGASATRWDRPVLILINIRLGIDGVHPRYYDSVKVSKHARNQVTFPSYFDPALHCAKQNIFTFPQSVGISGGRPSSSYYFMGCQDNTLFYLDPHHVRPAVPYQPPPRSIQRRGSSQSLAEAADSSVLDGEEREAWHADWWCQAYSEAQLNTFHCDKVRKMPMKSLDPSMLLGFLVKTPEQLDDFCARVKKLPEPIFSVADHAPKWDAVEDDDELDAAMESFSESSVDVNERRSDGNDLEDQEDEDIGFDTGAVSIPDPISLPDRPSGGRSGPAKPKPRTRAAPISTTVAPIQFPSMSSDDFEAGDEDAVDESTTVGHGAREVSRRRSSSARKSQSRRISGLGRRRVQRQSAEGHHLTSASGVGHSAFGPPGRYGSGISSRQTSGASTAREFSFSMPRGATSATAAAGGGNSTDISPSASTERGDHSLRSKVGPHASDRAMSELTSETALMTVTEPESSGESGFGEISRMRGVDETNDSGYVVTQAGSMSSDDADSTWSDLSGAQARGEQQDTIADARVVSEDQPQQEAEDVDGDEDQILVPAPSSSSSSSYPSATVDEGSMISEQRYAIVSIDSEDEPEFDGEESGNMDAAEEQLDNDRMRNTIKGISPSSSTRGSGFLNQSSSGSNSQQHSLYSSVSRNLLPTAGSSASLSASQPRRPPVTDVPSSFSAAFGIPASGSGSPSSHSPATLTAAASPIEQSSPVLDENADEFQARYEPRSTVGNSGRLSHSSSYVN
ncbi:Cysteine protease atg4 [Tilletia horrida]|nr:Cysteine protease atg4 [Tilletia horrida]